MPLGNRFKGILSSFFFRRRFQAYCFEVFDNHSRSAEGVWDFSDEEELSQAFDRFSTTFAKRIFSDWPGINPENLKMLLEFFVEHILPLLIPLIVKQNQTDFIRYSETVDPAEYEDTSDYIYDMYADQVLEIMNRRLQALIEAA